MTSRLDSLAVGDRRRSRAYLLDLARGVGVYFALLAASVPLSAMAGNGTWRWLVAALPLLPIAWIAMSVMRHLRRVDEFQRVRILEGLSVGFVVAMLTAVTLGLLNSTGLVVTSPQWWIYAAGMVAWVSTALLQRIR